MFKKLSFIFIFFSLSGCFSEAALDFKESGQGLKKDIKLITNITGESD